MKLKKNIAISESGFIFDPNTGESFSINPIGAEIIGIMKLGKSTDEIQSSILDKYDVDAASFEKYYYDFLNMLKQYNLVEEDE
ncbi:MAG: PqqD family protein [Bacteroidales bacterium]|nr:MAG: PqqD family protein [Bacteroidales bacterium]